jgi:hypothetical protein
MWLFLPTFSKFFKVLNISILQVNDDFNVFCETLNSIIAMHEIVWNVWSSLTLNDLSPVYVAEKCVN